MGLATAEFYVTPYRAMKQREAVLAIRGGRRLPTRTSLPLRLGYDLQHMGRVRLSIAGAVGSQPSSDKCRLRKSCSDGGGDVPTFAKSSVFNLSARSSVFPKLPKLQVQEEQAG